MDTKEAAHKISKEIRPNNRYSQEEFEKIAEKVRGVFLGAGCTRVAFKVGDVVIKFAYSGVVSDNRNEFDFWHTYKDSEIGQYIAKVIDIADDLSYITQEYCGETLGASVSDLPIRERVAKTVAIVNDARAVFEDAGVTPKDLHMSNISASGKVFDYAWFS